MLTAILLPVEFGDPRVVAVEQGPNSADKSTEVKVAIPYYAARVQK